MTDSHLVGELDKLSEAELLDALNATLASRRQPPTEEQLAQRAAQDADAEYLRYYPGGAR